MTVTCQFYTAGAARSDETAVSPDYPYANRPPFASCRCPQLRGGASVVVCGYSPNQSECGYYRAHETVLRTVTITLTSGETQDLILAAVRTDDGVPGYIIEARSPHGRVTLAEGISEGSVAAEFRSLVTAAGQAEWIENLGDDVLAPAPSRHSYANVVLGLPHDVTVA